MDLSYFNPRLQTEPDFLANFVARQQTLEFFLRQLRPLRPEQAARHFLLVAPRGFGKTSLLRRIAIATRAEADLRQRYIPLSFREEQHNVISLDVFWRNCLQSLLEAREDEQAPAAELDELDEAWSTFAPRQGLPREEQDGEPAYSAFRRYCTRLQRRPLLLIDNLDSLLAGLGTNHPWALRRVLQAAGGPVLIAAAARYPESIHDAQAAFYDFFRVHTLDKLSDAEVMYCLRGLAVRRGEPGRAVLDLLDRDPGRVAALNTLAGGNPRTLNVLYSVLESHLSSDILSQLSAMLDTFTGWYQARIEELPLQARAVFDALALNWDPVTAAALGEITGLETGAVSSHLSRLERIGYVESVALNRRGKGRNAYQVSERFFNIWYLMRNGPRRIQQRIRFLTVFLQSCFQPAERRAIAQRALSDDGTDPGVVLAVANCLPGGMLRQALLERAARQSRRFGNEDEYRAAIGDLRRLEVGLSATQPDESLGEIEEMIQRHGEAPELERRVLVARALVNKGVTLRQLGRPEQEVAAYDEVITRDAGSSEPALREPVAFALVNKGITLGSRLGRPEQALAAYDEVIKRDAESGDPALREPVAKALVNKGCTLGQLGRPEQALAAFEEVVTRDADSSDPALRVLVARALVNKGVALGRLGRPEQEVAAYDEVITRDAGSIDPALREQVAEALVNKGVTLAELGRPEQALAAFEEVVARDADSSDPALRVLVARALVNKGVALGRLGRPEQALAAYDEVITRDAGSIDPALREPVAKALVNKGVTLAELSRPEQALAAFEGVVARDADSSDPALRVLVARALVNKGVALGRLGRPEQALAAYDEVITRDAGSIDPALREPVAKALVNKGVTLAELSRPEQALAAFEEVVARDADSSDPALRVLVARALVNKGVALGRLGRPEQALAAYDEVITRDAGSIDPALREPVAKALVNKGVTLAELGRPEQALAAFEEVVARDAESSEPALREQVAAALFNKGVTLGRLGRLGRADEAASSLRQATALATATQLPSIYSRLGNLLLDEQGDPVAALDAYRSGLATSPTGDDRSFLHANCAYALALHVGDRERARQHLELALADNRMGEACRRLLRALSLIVDENSDGIHWTRLYEQIGSAVEAGDPSLWSDYLDDLQRLLWFVIASGQGATLRGWLETARYPLLQAPLYHAVIAAIDGDEHLLQINPETRQAAQRIYDGLARRLRVYAPATRGAGRHR
jgi:tetratricopeptide (TPR) repeat protein